MIKCISLDEKMQKNKVGTMEKMKKDEFDQIFDLMKLSFPIIEYRDYDAQKALLSDPHYQILTLPDTVSGFIKAAFRGQSAFPQPWAGRGDAAGAFVLHAQAGMPGSRIAADRDRRAADRFL